MLPAYSQRADSPTPATNSNQIPGAEGLSDGAESKHKRYFSDPDPTSVPVQTSLANRLCSSPVSDQADDYSPPSRHQLGGKGMFLQRMKEAGLRVPPFKCVTTQVMNALEHQPLDRHCLACYLPWIPDQPEAETSLSKIRKYVATLPPSEQAKRKDWLAGLATFIASDDYYQQVKESEAAQQIRDLRRQLDKLSLSQPIIVRSSGVNEDDYGNAQAGKYLSKLQGEEDVLRTCLEVMASAYRPEVCSEGVPQPMALVIQQCIDCKYGGVIMSFQSFQDDTVRIEFTPGQPGGVVAGQFGNTPHRIDIHRKEGAEGVQYFPGTISSHFILHKNNNGYSETRIDNVGVQSGDGGQKLSDKMVSLLKEVVAKLEDLLLCPVDAEFAIDHQGRLFLLQVRPVTRLSGGMDFAMPIPEETIASGESVSEGFCTGPIWLAREKKADSMPAGSIVVARHAEDWMLEPEFLKQAGGFVIAEGGFNDHVAILMKQAGKTLLLAGGQLTAVVAQDGQQATLACGCFKGKPGAFIVAGDLTGKLLSHRSLCSAVSDVPLANAVPSREDLSPAEGTFDQVTSGFQWLTDQNARLLAFFASGGGLDCLANPIKLSMSPQRSKLLAGTRDSVNRLIYGAEALLDGYKSLLQLAANRDPSKVQPWLNELPQLSNRFETLKGNIQSVSETFILPLQAGGEGQKSMGVFRQWLAACHQLQSSLKALNPNTPEQVRSVHELIFALHKRFVKALAPVTLASGQGRISGGWPVTYVDCRTPGGPFEKAPLFNRSCKVSLIRSECRGTVIIMDDALIVNLELGQHVGLIELLENAEGGKGRTLRLKFSDRFARADGSDGPGKLKRMWFLVQLLRAINLDGQAGNMKLSCNAVAGEMIVECARMTLRQTLQDAFVKLMTALHAIQDIDIYLKDCSLFEGDQWNFDLLAQRLDRDIATEADRFAFQHCLFSTIYDYSRMSPDCCQLLSKQHQQFIDYVQRLEECWKKPKEHFREVLMSDEISEDTRRELLHHLLLIDAQKAIPLVEDVYPDLRDQYYVIETSSCSYRMGINAPPAQSLAEDREKVKSFFLKHGLKYASQRVRNDKDLVLATIVVNPYNLKYVSKALKHDKQVVLSCFKTLNLLKTEEVRRVNDLIFDLHWVLTEARTLVTTASALGMLSRDENFIYVDCRIQGGTAEKASVLSPSCRASLRESRPLRGTVISMDDNLIVNFELFGLVGLIELIENADEGKGSTLRLKFSDKFSCIDCSDAPGKLKRMWFLVQLLKAIELGENADSIRSVCNAAAAEVMVECSQITSPQAMQDAFVKLITALRAVISLDILLGSISIFDEGRWCFNSLAQRLDSDVAAEANRFAFQHCFFLMIDNYQYGIDPDCCQLLNNHQQQFIDHGYRLVKSKDNLREVLISDELPEDICRELLHHFLLLDPGRANRWVELVYPHLKDHYFVIKPSCSYSLKFDFSPVQSLGDNKEQLRHFLLRDGLMHASQRIRNDKDLVLATVAIHPDSLKYVSEELQNVAEVVMLAITKDGCHLQYASPTVQDDEKVVVAAVTNSLGALQYASERIRSDKNIIKTLIAVNINCLMYVNNTVLKDRDYMLDLIQKDSAAFIYVASELKQNAAFIEAAKKRNPEVSQHLE
ncbi:MULTISPECIES: DUF4116 domain-containing protein [unclassified Endozoicomonas]|uniref:DUF4116 domain-containing protein n=1 Tax=unclassified Endozoicomonas TaxID=2644528 RepID=UPI003BB77AC7